MAKITKILSVPGLTATPAKAVLSVGLVLDGRQVVWGASMLPTKQMAAVTATLQRIVVPELHERPLTTFRELDNLIASLIETITLTETIPPPVSPPGTFSRRALISGFQAKSPPLPPVTREVTRTDRVQPALRYALSQALLQAVAWRDQCSPAEVIAREYGFEVTGTAVPLHAEIDPLTPLTVEMIRHSPIASLGYSLSGTNPAAELGQDGEVLQKFAQQLKEMLLGTVDPQSLAFHFNVRGSYGQLRDNKLGLILGILFSLEKAAEPFLVRIEDPFIMSDRDEQIKKMAMLKGYLKNRRMKLELVAQAGIQSAADAQAFVTGNAAHMLHLDFPQMGQIDEGITAVQVCQQNEIGTLWGGQLDDSDIAARLSVPIAMAVQPTLLLVKNGRLGSTSVSSTHNEMGRLMSHDVPSQ